MGDYSKLQGDLNVIFDQQESEINHHKVTSSPELPRSESPGTYVKYNRKLTVNIENYLPCGKPGK